MAVFVVLPNNLTALNDQARHAAGNDSLPNTPAACPRRGRLLPSLRAERIKVCYRTALLVSKPGASRPSLSG
jgi:hypothetical protein